MIRLAALLVIFVGLNGSPATAADYLGAVTAVDDGDSFHMLADGKDVHIRLCGIDSPERSKPGYGKAAGALAELVEGKQVHCLQVGEGTPCDGRSKPWSRDRAVAQCFIGDKDIAAEMVRSKHACDWPRFSNGVYRLDAATCVRE
ncbi:thermonuclease family protein [Bradyrhizobium symbiodeficiens]|uniref:thermonuclease family protein n=1 Tax=Bradyrhizobium symbiodeficiens TaxID=1404367 RepID=UPI000D6E9A7E|nr:thermonuclease family protein [Bradyrhizobium symbiodeficiens]AWM07618.1 hypothetical protein CIT39_14970 [Bradyrhizobium symbiodeficiens]